MLTTKGLPHAAVNPPSLTRKQKLFFVLFLLILLLLSYSNTFDSAWQFDDISNISANPHLHLKDLSFTSLQKTLFAEMRRPDHLYRPVACLTFALNYYFGGQDVFGYHVVNLAIHFLASLFLFLFIYRTLLLPSLSGRYAVQAYPIALLAAVLWAIHPIQTQAVTYIVQRMTSLSGLFYILSMYAYLRFRQVPNPSARALYLGLCVLGFVLSFGSKENGILLPPSLFLYEIVLIQRRPADLFRKGAKKILLISIGVLALGLVYLLYEKGGAFHFLNEYSFRPFSLHERLLTQPRIILFYLSLLLYPDPARFSIAHSFQVSTSLFNPPSTGLAILALGACLACLIAFVRRIPLVSFSFLFFLLNHVLESSVFALELVYEHRNYIPSMFFFLPFAVGLVKGVHSFRGSRFMKYSMTALVLFLVFVPGHATYVRNLAWKTHKTLWTDALQKAPDQMRVYYSLGLHYRELGQWEKAIHYYLEGLERSVVHIKNEAYMLYYELGKAYSGIGDHPNAIRCYLEALRLNPDLYPALINLAAQYDAEGNEALAELYVRKALEAVPKNESANLNMGIYQFRKRMMDEAVPFLEKAMKDENLRARAYLYLGIIYKRRGQLGRAAIYLKSSAAMSSRDVSPHLHLVEVYHLAGFEERSLHEGKIILDMIGKDDALFRRTIDLVLQEAGTRGSPLYGDVVLHVLYQALNSKSDAFESQLSHLKKILDKNSKNE